MQAKNVTDENQTHLYSAAQQRGEVNRLDHQAGTAHDSIPPFEEVRNALLK
jgi:hypothetical protein